MEKYLVNYCGNYFYVYFINVLVLYQTVFLNKVFFRFKLIILMVYEVLVNAFERLV